MQPGKHGKVRAEGSQGLDFLLDVPLEITVELGLPIMVILSMVAIISNLAQTGFIWSVEPLTLEASKINPIDSAKRIFSKRFLVELAKSIALKIR